MGVGLQDFCVCNTWGGCAFGWAPPELSQHLSFPDSELFTGSALFTLQGFAGFQFVNLLQRLCGISVMNGSKALLREWALLLEKSNYLGRAALWGALPLSPSCCTGAKGGLDGTNGLVNDSPLFMSRGFVEGLRQSICISWRKRNWKH